MKNIFLFYSTLFLFHSAFSQNAIHPNDQHLTMCGPIASVCYPSSVNTGGIMGLGPTYFSLGQISNSSTNNSTVGYQDFTCSDSSYLNQGDSYPIQIITGQTYAEVIRVWIDFNNDGSFDSTELIFGDLPTVYSHNGFAFIPVTGLLGIPLRLRMGSEVDLYAPPDGCSNVQYGQYEDYTVYLNGPTAISGLTSKPFFSLYPNPFHSKATFSALQPAKGIDISNSRLKIYNSLGALVREEKILNGTSGTDQDYTLHRGDLNDGMYFYELTTKEYELLGNGKFIVD